MRAASVKIKCSFCGNSFMAPPADAVCQKCGRPANKPLDARWRAISFLVPPVGLGNALWIRPHSPVAFMQGLVASIAGFVVFGVIYGLLRLF